MDNLLEQLEQWNKNDEFSRCIEAIEAIPEKERGYKLTVLLGRAYSNLVVLGDHKAHGDDDEVDKELIQHSIDILETVWKQGENDPYWKGPAAQGYHLKPPRAKGGLATKSGESSLKHYGMHCNHNHNHRLCRWFAQDPLGPFACQTYRLIEIFSLA